MKCNCGTKNKNIMLLSSALDKNLLFIPQRTIYRWIREGKHRNVFFKVLGRIAVDLDEMNRMIEEAKKKETRRRRCSCSDRTHNLVD
jgi:predicted site-specific integrase-resolvase